MDGPNPVGPDALRAGYLLLNGALALALAVAFVATGGGERPDPLDVDEYDRGQWGE